MMVVYRKSVAEKFRQPTKAVAERAEKVALATMRVDREDTLTFFREGGFRALPALSSAEVRNRAMRMLDHEASCWVVPSSQYGRIGTDTRSTCESFRLWIAKNCAPWITGKDEVAVVWEEGWVEQ